MAHEPDYSGLCRQVVLIQRCITIAQVAHEASPGQIRYIQSKEVVSCTRSRSSELHRSRSSELHQVKKQ